MKNKARKDVDEYQKNSMILETKSMSLQIRIPLTTFQVVTN